MFSCCLVIPASVVSICVPRSNLCVHDQSDLLLQDRTFSALPGVTTTRVGYTGGSNPEPSYQSVCSNDGHTEAVQIHFDKQAVSYEDLLRVPTCMLLELLSITVYDNIAEWFPLSVPSLCRSSSRSTTLPWRRAKLSTSQLFGTTALNKRRQPKL